MTQEEFHRYYEDESDSVFSKFSKMTEGELLEIIADKNKGRFNIWKGGDNYQIWRALQIKGTQWSLRALFEVVRDLKHDYLIRYHACEALFKIANLEDEAFKREVQLGFDSENKPVDREANFRKLEAMLTFPVGTRTDNKPQKPWWKVW